MIPKDINTQGKEQRPMENATNNESTNEPKNDEQNNNRKSALIKNYFKCTQIKFSNQMTENG